MKTITRREVMTRLAGAGALVGAVGHTALAANPGLPPPPSATLGRTGITTSRLAFGTGFNGGNRQSEHTRMGFAKLVDLFHHCHDRGITCFDLADLYGSHVYCREALRSIPRDKVTLLTKLYWQYDSTKPAELPADYKVRSANQALERFRHELSVDMIDIVLLHCLVNPDWTGEMQPYMDALSAAKEKGLIRAVGVSCHNFGAMQTAVDCPWVDVILARLNPGGVAMDASPDEVLALLRKARARGMGVIGMKIFGAGKLLDQREACMRYAQSNGAFDAMTIGATTTAQVDENLALMARYPAA
jgi:aryl-alcohol dehydrogenase-like predicted oxidoreductase